MEEIPPQSQSPIYFQPQSSKVAKLQVPMETMLTTCTTLSGLDHLLISQMSSPSIIKHATKGSTPAQIAMVVDTHYVGRIDSKADGSKAYTVKQM